MDSGSLTTPVVPGQRKYGRKISADSAPQQKRPHVDLSPIARMIRICEMEARQSLNYPPVRFTRDQIDCIADGFAEAVKKFSIDLYACAILWDHVHIVAQRHRETIEFLARVLKSAATRNLTTYGIHPMAKFVDATGRAPTPWADGGWERYLNTPPEIVAVVKYVNDNPEKHGLPRQHWPFVTLHV